MFACVKIQFFLFFNLVSITMKKKLEALLREDRVLGNAEFKKLHGAYQTAKTALERAKHEKSEARQLYREANTSDEKDGDRLLELLTAFRQAKSMVKYHRAGWQWAKHRLHRWLEVWLTSAPTPEQVEKVRPVKTKPGKIAPAKTSATPKPAKKAKPA